MFLLLFMQSLDFLMSIVLFIFFVYQFFFKKRCRFEVLYTTGIGSITDAMKLFVSQQTPATFTILENNIIVYWSRWAGWLVTCPVLLFHLSNLAGNEHFNVQRTMYILVAYQIMMIAGVTCSMKDMLYVKILLWIFGALMLGYIFYESRKIFNESYRNMPDRAHSTLKCIDVVFHSSWSGFAVCFFIGPEGLHLIPLNTTRLLYALFDIMSKNIYAMLGYHLRWNILRMVSQRGMMRLLIIDNDSLRKCMLKDAIFEFNSNILIDTETYLRYPQMLFEYDIVCVDDTFYDDFYKHMESLPDNQVRILYNNKIECYSSSLFHYVIPSPFGSNDIKNVLNEICNKTQSKKFRISQTSEPLKTEQIPEDTLAIQDLQIAINKLKYLQEHSFQNQAN